MSQLFVVLYLLAGVFWAREADAYSQEKRHRPIRWTTFLGITIGWFPLLLLGAAVLFFNRGN